MKKALLFLSLIIASFAYSMEETQPVNPFQQNPLLLFPEEKERALAFAMALQPRLGADSPANCLPRELVQEIATIATYTTVNEWLESNKGRIEYWRSQRQHDRNYDLLMRAQIGAIDLVRILLYTGANPNFADTNGTTSMHLAAISGNQTIIAILLAVGADHTMRAASGYYSGMTAAEVARHCGRGVLADLIEQWGSGHRSEVESE